MGSPEERESVFHEVPVAVASAPNLSERETLAILLQSCEEGDSEL